MRKMESFIYTLLDLLILAADFLWHCIVLIIYGCAAIVVLFFMVLAFSLIVFLYDKHPNILVTAVFFIVAVVTYAIKRALP